MTPALLTAQLKEQARELGFALAGACAAVAPAGFARLQQWLDAEYDGEMKYLSRRRQAYSHPSHVLPGVRSLLLLAMPYRTTDPKSSTPGEGRVSRYAWNERDYHDIVHERLDRMIEQWQRWSPEARVRGVIDTAPLLEREFAQLAGLGWFGKNTLLLNKFQGSWFFLAALLTDQELAYDEPHAADHCGTCRACLDACPTQAFPQPYVLDATKCISYLTIELRDAIPTALRPGMKDWLFGCDVCQDVCPWNHRAPEGDLDVFGPLPDMNPVSLKELFWLDDDSFRKRFRRTPLWRPRRRGLLRNAAIVLGNQRDATAVEALARGLVDQEEIVRGASAWALGRIGSEAARGHLRMALVNETIASVREEIQSALQ